MPRMTEGRRLPRGPTGRPTAHHGVMTGFRHRLVGLDQQFCKKLGLGTKFRKLSTIVSSEVVLVGYFIYKIFSFSDTFLGLSVVFLAVLVFIQVNKDGETNRLPKLLGRGPGNTYLTTHLIQLF